MASAYNKFNQTAADIMHGLHNLSTAAIVRVMLSNTIPTSSMTTSTDITQISSGNGYTGGSLGGSSVALTSSIQSSGTFKLVANALVFTAAGGTIGPFRYQVLYNASTAVATGPLLGWYDYGSAISLNDTETLTMTWDASSGILQLA